MAQTTEAKKLQDLVDSTTQQKTIAENQKAIAEAQKPRLLQQSLKAIQNH